MTRAPIDRLLDTVKFGCLICGAPMGKCDCWEACSCGWTARKGKPCGNPNTTRCSTKVKYGGTANNRGAR